MDRLHRKNTTTIIIIAIPIITVAIMLNMISLVQSAKTIPKINMAIIILINPKVTQKAASLG